MPRRLHPKQRAQHRKRLRPESFDKRRRRRADRIAAYEKSIRDGYGEAA